MIHPFLLPVLVAAPEPTSVVVQARSLQLPNLPKDLAQARLGYPALRQDIETSLQEMAQELASLRAGAAMDFPLDMRVPPESTAEVLFLLQVLSDEAFLEVRGPVLDRWNSWQTDLLRAGLANTREGSAITANMELLSAGIKIFGPDVEGDECCRLLFGNSKKEERLYAGMDLFELVAVGRAPYQRHGILGKTAVEQAQMQAPLLQARWGALMEYLNTSAIQWMDFEQNQAPARMVGLQVLRRQAKIHVFERFRSALWLCQVIWAHMASEILPRPLPKPE